MRTHSFRTLLQRHSLIQLTIVLLTSLVVVYGFAAGVAQSPQDNASASNEDERRVENTVPAHVPVKLKVKNEKSLKDVKNKKWARELEIEVKNTGSKPIYFIYLIVLLPDFVLEDGNPVGFQVKYGRGELVRLDTPVQPDDVPISPGGSITLKIPESRVAAYEEIRSKKNKNDPKKVRFELQLINFGDGTGLQSIKGEPIPDSGKSLSQNNLLPSRGSGACKPPPKTQAASYSSSFLKTYSALTPASFLRANFLTLRKKLPTHLRLCRFVIVTARTFLTAFMENLIVRGSVHATTIATFLLIGLRAVVVADSVHVRTLP